MDEQATQAASIGPDLVVRKNSPLSALSPLRNLNSRYARGAFKSLLTVLSALGGEFLSNPIGRISY
jgi:hypothetical protein